METKVPKPKAAKSKAPRKRRDLLTQDRLVALISYDPVTGIFAWRQSRRGVRPGICGRISKGHGYLEICIDKVLYRANRLAFLYMNGEFPQQWVDHENRDKTDNRWSNLREASPSQNMSNVEMKPSNTSGLIGVTWDKARSKWRAQIRLNGKKVNLGRFETAEDAVNAHDYAAVREFGEFAQINRSAA